jgi:hypothetical protein
MGAKVSQFFKDTAVAGLKALGKGVTSFVLGKVPIVGSKVADWINSKYAKGGRLHKFADGGLVERLKEAGAKTQVINTPAQLISAINKFPEIASKAGLTVEMVKEGAKEAKQAPGNVQSKMADANVAEIQPVEPPKMKRGGRRHKKHEQMEHVEEMHHAHGGMMAKVASLPISNLNRLNMPGYAHGGMHHMDVGLSRDHGEESYVKMHHGMPYAHQRPHHHGRIHA